MNKLNAKNERIKRDYFRFQKEARGKSEATIDAMRKSLARFEEQTGHKDFATFRREQAIAFKRHLSGLEGVRSGETISLATQASTLNMLKEFFQWLAWQPGFKSRLHVPDVDYFTPSRKDASAAKAAKLRDYPSLEQIRAVVQAMPANTVVERRDRALLAFTILTGMRDRALASLSLRHIDLHKSPPLVRQEPDRVDVKFSKAINTYFFPVGEDLKTIVIDWVEELRTQHLFSANDPLFPKTRLGRGNDMGFRTIGIEPAHWADASPIRAIFKAAFARAGLPYFPPHSFRHTLVHMMQSACRTPEEIKAWSQNLGHESIATTMTSYGKVDPHRQGEVLGRIGMGERDEDDLRARLRALIA